LGVDAIVNPKISPTLRAVLVLLAFSFPVAADYFVFFSLTHYSFLARGAYWIVGAAIAIGAALVASIFAGGGMRMIAASAFGAIALASTWVAGLYVACTFYGSCP